MVGICMLVCFVSLLMYFFFFRIRYISRRWGVDVIIFSNFVVVFVLFLSVL